MRAHRTFFLALLAGWGANVLAPSTLRAAETERPVLSLAAGVGPHLLVQEGHAPPLCCGERDRWVAPGGQMRLEAGAMLGPYLRVFLGGAYAYDLHAGESKEADRIRIAEARLGLDVIAVRRDDVALGLGLFGSYGRAWGTFPRYPFANAETTLAGAGLRAQADLFPLFTETTGLAFDLSAAKYMIVHNAWSASAMFIWAP